MESPKDELFQKERSQSKDFDFGEDTAKVFDDMLERSVPYYTETQRMIWGEYGGPILLSPAPTSTIWAVPPVIPSFKSTPWLPRV